VIAKASMVAFGKPFYQRGLLSRRTLLRALWGQLVYMQIGASEETLTKMRDRALALTRGWEQTRISAIVRETLEEVVEPIIFSEAADLIDEHHAAGRKVFIVSASPEEIVAPLAQYLGADQAIASRARLDRHGRYTGEMQFYAYGPAKADAMREVARRQDIDLDASYAYSDSATDIPMLEVVGHPVAVNPDRELARVAKDRGWETGLDLPDRVRAKGKLTVIPMRGWTRSMRWSDTGLNWVPTSPLIGDFAAVQGYAMVGLGAFWDPPKIDTGFRHGIGRSYPFRGISRPGVKPDALMKELNTFELHGIRFHPVSAPDKDGKPQTGLFVEIIDYDAWDPTELNFVLMKLACRLDPKNPFLPAKGRDFGGFLRHMGSPEFLAALQRDGARIDLATWLNHWREQDHAYQQQSRKYWLYQ